MHDGSASSAGDGMMDGVQRRKTYAVVRSTPLGEFGELLVPGKEVVGRGG